MDVTLFIARGWVLHPDVALESKARVQCKSPKWESKARVQGRSARVQYESARVQGEFCAPKPSNWTAERRRSSEAAKENLARGSGKIDDWRTSGLGQELSLPPADGITYLTAKKNGRTRGGIELCSDVPRGAAGPQGLGDFGTGQPGQGDCGPHRHRSLHAVPHDTQAPASTTTIRPAALEASLLVWHNSGAVLFCYHQSIVCSSSLANDVVPQQKR